MVLAFMAIPLCRLGVRKIRLSIEVFTVCRVRLQRCGKP
jgi:hypothetical protein